MKKGSSKFLPRQPHAYVAFKDYSKLWMLEVTDSVDGLPMRTWVKRVQVRADSVELAVRKIKSKLPYQMKPMGAEFYSGGIDISCRVLPWKVEDDDYILKGGCDLII